MNLKKLLKSCLSLMTATALTAAMAGAVVPGSEPETISAATTATVDLSKTY